MKIAAITATAVLLVPAALHAEGKGVVNTYPAVSSCTGLDYDPSNGWLWQTSSGPNNGEVVTVDPEDGSFSHSFYVPERCRDFGAGGKRPALRRGRPAPLCDRQQRRHPGHLR